MSKGQGLTPSAKKSSNMSKTLEKIVAAVNVRCIPNSATKIFPHPGSICTYSFKKSDRMRQVITILTIACHIQHIEIWGNFGVTWELSPKPVVLLLHSLKRTEQLGCRAGSIRERIGLARGEPLGSDQYTRRAAMGTQRRPRLGRSC